MFVVSRRHSLVLSRRLVVDVAIARHRFWWLTRHSSSSRLGCFVCPSLGRERLGVSFLFMREADATREEWHSTENREVITHNNPAGTCTFLSAYASVAAGRSTVRIQTHEHGPGLKRLRHHVIAKRPRQQQCTVVMTFSPLLLASRPTYHPSALLLCDVVSCAPQLLMNPFYAYDSPVISPAFDQRVKALARKLL